MPIHSQHPEYAAMLPEWQKARDACDAQAIRAAGARYLPLLSSHEDDRNAYNTYLARALWFGATGRTVAGMAGAVMRILPQVEAPDGLKDWLQDVTGSGQSFDLFAGEAVEEALKVGRFGLLVDRKGEGKPYLALYQAESITNWLAGGDQAVVLHEVVHEAPDPADPYEVKAVEQYRELLIQDGRYLVRTHRENAKGAWEFTEVMPEKRGQGMQTIPFVFCSSDGDPVGVSKPPLIDLINVNYSHYTLYADYRHGLFFGGHPTPVFIGLDSDASTSPISLGTSRPVFLPQGGDAKWMEFTGQGLSAMKDELQTLEDRMASLGAQMLQAPKAAAEAAQTVRLNRSAEASQLENIVYRVEAALTQALRFVAEWEGLDPNACNVTLNHDLVDESLTPQDVQARMQLWQAGGIDLDTMLKGLQKGGVIEPGADLDEIKQNIDKENEAPKLLKGLPVIPGKAAGL